MASNIIPDRASLAYKAVVLFSIIIVLEVLYLGGLAIMVEQTKLQLEKERQARAVLECLSGGIRSTQNVVVGLAEFLLVQSNHEQIISPEYARSLKELPLASARIDELKIENTQDKLMLEQIQENCKELPQLCENIRTTNVTNKWNQNGMSLLRLDGLFHELFPKVEELETRYRRIDQDVNVALNEQSRLLLNLAMLFGFGINAGIAFVLYRSFASGLAKRLQDVSEDMVKVAIGKPLPQRTFGNDEVDRLALSLRSMASKLEDYRGKEKAMLNNAASFICALDKNATIVEVSSGSSALWGYTPDELYGTKFTDFLEGNVEFTLEEIKEAFANNTAVNFENVIRKKDGTLVELSWRCRLSEDEQTAVCVAQDVTNRFATMRLIKQRQEDFRGIVDGMPFAVVACDRSYVISSVNPSTQTIFRFQTSELLGKSLSLLLTGSLIATENAAEQLGSIMALAEKQAVELNAWRSDGSQLPVELNVRRYAIEGATTYLATFQDVSARAEIERVKRDFVAMISHDLRSPLTALHGTLDLIVNEVDLAEAVASSSPRSGKPISPEDPSSTDAAKQANPLRQSQGIVEALVHLMNDFLDLEKFESGTAVLDIAQVTVGDLIDSTVENLGQEKASRVVSSSLTDSRDLRIDRSRMALALSNVLATVFRYSSEGSQLELSEGTDKNGFTLRITAVGFKLPARVKEAFFSRYILLSKEDTGEGSSSGVGLALSRAVMHAHGGTLSLASEGERDVICLNLLERA